MAIPCGLAAGFFIFEHLEDLLPGSTNPRTNVALFGLVFDVVPTYTELTSRTIQLACVFELSEEYKKAESVRVRPVGFEPTTNRLRGDCSTAEL